MSLEERLQAVAADLPSGALGVSVHDHLSGRSWSVNGDRWFHSASVMKIAVLVALFDAVDQRRFTLDCRLHVRNRFLSVVDGDADVRAAVGRTMRLRDLVTPAGVAVAHLDRWDGNSDRV